MDGVDEPTTVPDEHSRGLPPGAKGLTPWKMLSLWAPDMLVSSRIKFKEGQSRVLARAVSSEQAASYEVEASRMSALGSKADVARASPNRSAPRGGEAP